MNYSNSSLVNYTKISPNKNAGRVNSKYNPTGVIDKITIHHMAGNLSVETCGNVFASTSRQASSTYGIGTDGRIGQYVDESDRPWTSSSAANDYHAVTIEVANSSTGGDWPVSDAAYESLIKLCVDICRRNGIERINYTGDTSGNLTMHKWFAATACPGPYLESRFSDIANRINAELSGESTDIPPAPEKKSNEEIAKEVIAGKWGNGSERKQKIESAGYNYSEIQSIVNSLMSGNTTESAPEPAKKSNEEIADEVIKGLWGNGSDRKSKIESAGYDYSAIQSIVNQKLTGSSSTSSNKKSNEEVAKEVIRGEWGNGSERKSRLTAAGYDYGTIQSIVNKML